MVTLTRLFLSFLLCQATHGSSRLTKFEEIFLSMDSPRVCFDQGVHFILDPQSMAFHLVDSNMIEVAVQVHVCANQNCCSCMQRDVA